MRLGRMVDVTFCGLSILWMAPSLVWSKRLGENKNPEEASVQHPQKVASSKKVIGSPLMPPWTRKALPLVVHDNQYASWRADKSILSPNGETLASAYGLQGRTGNVFYTRAYRIETYAYLKQTREWIPVDSIHKDLPSMEDGNLVIASDVVMASKTLGFHSVSIFDDRPGPFDIRRDDDDYENHMTYNSTIHLWSLSDCLDNPEKLTCWSELKPPLENKSDYKDKEGFGLSLAIADDGATNDSIVTVAVGVPSKDNVGRVEVYQYDPKGDIFLENGEWNMLGKEIYGSEECFGRMVALSGDGTVLSALTPVPGNHDFDDECALSVHKFEQGGWVQVGQEIVGLLGCATMVMSGDGSTIAVGSRVADPGSPRAPKPRGQVRVFTYDKKASSWLPKGVDLDTLVDLIREEEHFAIGRELTLSHDGNKVAMSVVETLPKSSLDVASYVVTFEWNGSEWTQGGSQLSVPNAVLFSSSMSQDGMTLVTNYEDTTRRGIVETFSWDPSMDVVKMTNDEAFAK